MSLSFPCDTSTALTPPLISGQSPSVPRGHRPRQLLLPVMSLCSLSPQGRCLGTPEPGGGAGRGSPPAMLEVGS